MAFLNRVATWVALAALVALSSAAPVEQSQIVLSSSRTSGPNKISKTHSHTINMTVSIPES